MASIVMPPAANFNVKAAQNTACWTCEHYQNYGITSGNGDLQLCEGECRKQPPRAANYTLELDAPTDWPRDGYFTYIPFGNVAWCNGYQRTLDPSSVPASPGTSSSDCPHTDPVTWVAPSANRGPNQANKKPIENTCWFCDNFQRLHETAQQEAAESCKGYCQHSPQPDYTFEESYIPTVPPRRATLEKYPLFTKIPYGPITWCSRWERATHEVPVVPVGPTQIVCEVSGP